MNFESFAPSEQEKATKNVEQKKPAQSNGFRTKITTLVGGILAATSIASASDKNLDTNNSESMSAQTSLNRIETKPTSHDDEMFEMLHDDEKYTWGVEYVSKPNSDHLTMRYVKVDKTTNQTNVIGEYDTIFQAAEGLEKIPDLPPNILAIARHEAGALKAEQNFKKSGLVETASTDINSNSTNGLHPEKRAFEGYGINVENTLQVDKNENVVRVEDSFDKNTGERLQ